MGSLVRNERTKLTATYFNGVAIATFAVGALAPIINVANGQTIVGVSTAFLAAICILISAALHFLARRILKGLQP